MYSIQLDASKIFECTLKLKGVNIKNSKVNLVIESDDFDIRCRGTITENGNVSIPITKLKGILEEESKGKLYLEVIAEDNYFIPFNSEYITEISKKIAVVNENVTFRDVESPVQVIETSIKGLSTSSKKTEKNKTSLEVHAKKIIKELYNNKINIYKSDNKNKVNKFIKEYTEKNNIKKSEYNNLLEQIIKYIMK